MECLKYPTKVFRYLFIFAVLHHINIMSFQYLFGIIYLTLLGYLGNLMQEEMYFYGN